jgi:small-conductance mechanosensitive channel
MALFHFRTRNPGRDRETDTGRLQRLERLLNELGEEMERERDGLRDRYEKVTADAAFSQQALEEDRADAAISSKIDGMTDTMIRYTERLTSLEKQLAFIAELRGRVDEFSRTDTD